MLGTQGKWSGLAALAAFAFSVMAGVSAAGAVEVVIHVPLAVLGAPTMRITPPTGTPGGIPMATASPPPGAGHHPDEDCATCHDYQIAGTVHVDVDGGHLAPGVPLTLIKPDGGQVVTAGTDGYGNLADSSVPDGVYLMQLDAVTSKTWHGVPDQGSCNVCHMPGGNGDAMRIKQLDTYHSRLPVDNACTHCHHFPDTQALDELMTLGVLSPAVEAPAVPGSRVLIGGRAYEFDPADHTIETVRPDVFAPSYFSMFDAILAVAAANGIDIAYEWDELRATHFIGSVEGVERDYWYHFSYDTGSARGNERELAYRRANRWDETLWRPGAWVQLVAGEDLDRIKAEYLAEIERERRVGHVVPSVRFQINPTQYQGNPPGSGRITVRREFADVTVTAHDLRAIGASSPHSQPFQPGVVTSLDIVLSLMDQRALDAVTSVFYSNFSGNYIDGYYVVELDFPGVGSAHSSGRQGIVYVTENGAFKDLPNGADPKLHMTADIHVIHAPDFSYWRWIELGNPFYEGGRDAAVDPMILEDDLALGRGFNLHPPTVDAGSGGVTLTFNVMEPGRFSLIVRDEDGERVASLVDGPVRNVGLHRVVWRPSVHHGRRLSAEMSSGQHVQVRGVPTRRRIAPSGAGDGGPELPVLSDFDGLFHSDLEGLVFRDHLR